MGTPDAASEIAGAPTSPPPDQAVSPPNTLNSPTALPPPAPAVPGLLLVPQMGQDKPLSSPRASPRTHEERQADGKNAGDLAQADPPRHWPASGLFGPLDSENIKDKIRQAKQKAIKEPYNVHDFYHETGWFQRLARNEKFDNTTLSIIVINALWISFDTDGNTADTILDAEAIYITADCMFFGYFSFELFTRFMAFKSKRNCFKDGWFCFDSALVGLYAFDPFSIGLLAYLSGGGGLNLPTAVLRLFRLARLSRLVRMLRSLPELMVMIKGMVSATSSVGYTLLLLMLITYVFAIALRNLVPPESNIEEAYFWSVPDTMHKLIVYATFLDALSDFMYDVKADSPACFILCWMYVCLAALTVMNMLIGVLCEVIAAVAEEEKESMITDKVYEKFGEIVKELDTSGDNKLSWEEFQHILDIPEALSALESVNVDAEVIIDMAEDKFYDDGVESSITFDEFMEMVLDLRGGQEALVSNVMKLQKHINAKFLKLKKRNDGHEHRLQGIEDQLDILLTRKGIVVEKTVVPHEVAGDPDKYMPASRPAPALTTALLTT